MGGGTSLAEALVGLPGFRVLEVSETPDELVARIETTAVFTGCEVCGTRAQAHDRVEVAIRDPVLRTPGVSQRGAVLQMTG